MIFNLNRKSVFCLKIACVICTAQLAYAEEDEDDPGFRGNRDAIRQEIRSYLTETEEGQELQEFIRDRLSKNAQERLMRAMRVEPEEAEHLLEYAQEIREEYEGWKREDPEQAELYLQVVNHEIRAEFISEQYREASEDDAPAETLRALRQELKEELEKAFEKKLKIQEWEVYYLERELNDLKSMLEKRTDSKGVIIEKKIKEMTGELDYLDW